MSTCLRSVQRQHMMQRADITSAGISDLRPVTQCHPPITLEEEKTHQGQSLRRVYQCKINKKKKISP